MRMVIISLLAINFSLAMDEHHKEMKSLTNCKRCHGIVYKGKDPLEIKRFDYKDNMTAKTGVIMSGQKMSDSYLNLKGKDQLNRPWDIHTLRGVRCIDCHLNAVKKADPNWKEKRLVHLKMDPRQFKAGDYKYDPNIGFEEHPKCSKCHDPSSVHQEIPYWQRHLQKLKCTACHVPSVMGPAMAEIVDGKITKYHGVSEQGSMNSMYLEGFKPRLHSKGEKLGPYNDVLVIEKGKQVIKRYAIGHGVQRMEFQKLSCEECHQKMGIIGSTDGGDFYIFGSSEIKWISLLGALLFVITVMGIFLHGLIRYLMRKKKKHVDLKEEFFYPIFERIWHWGMAVLVIFLSLSGITIHQGGALFEIAVKIHNILSILFIIHMAFGFWMLMATGTYKQFIPNMKTVFKETLLQVRYYTFGIFAGADHPVHTSQKRRFNPLQQITYLKLLLGLIPIQVISGILIFFASDVGGLFWTGPLHFAGSILFIIFLFMHVYMTTTGHTPFAHIRAMITGYELVPGDKDEKQ